MILCKVRILFINSSVLLIAFFISSLSPSLKIPDFKDLFCSSCKSLKCCLYSNSLFIWLSYLSWRDSNVVSLVLPIKLIGSLLDRLLKYTSKFLMPSASSSIFVLVLEIDWSIVFVSIIILLPLISDILFCTSCNLLIR